jgi:hypothetical protein
LWFEDELGGTIGEPVTVAPHQGTIEWTKDTLAIHSPLDAAAVQIWCQVIADGYAWFDDVSWHEEGSGGGMVWIIVIGVLLGIGGLLILKRRRT